MERPVRSDVPKKEFDKVLARFEAARGKAAYHEMVKDINIILRDWEENFSEQLRDTAYPSWKRGDFRRLLSELGEKEWEDVLQTRKKEDTEGESVQEQKERQAFIEETRKKDNAERKKIQRDLLQEDLKSELHKLKHELRYAQESLSTQISLEDELASHQKTLEEHADALKKMGWFGRLRNREMVNTHQKNMEYPTQRIKEIEEYIAQHPLEERLAKKAKDDRERKKKVDDLTEKIAVVTARLKEIQES